jgi:NRAMP (natural resistance-associated macrophage protein)-like metal ion transporter
MQKRTASPKRDRTETSKKKTGLRWILGLIGPGFITGASDDDPSGIATYAVAGASFGFATLWTALITFPLMATVQFICAKIGMVTGQGLAGVLKKHYPRWILIPAVIALLIANTFNAGADIGAIAAAINLIAPIPPTALIIPIAIMILLVQIWSSYRLLAAIFKWLTLSLVAYIGAAYFAHPNATEVLRGTLIPTIRVDTKFLSVLVAILGTTISPYLFFWQASQEVEEDIAAGKKTVAARKGASDDELRTAAWDVNLGMFFSNLVMYFIILATAATLFKAGKTDIQSATDAAQALTPIAGRFATTLLAIGLVGTGILAVPVLTGSSAYALSETFGWKYGLDEKPHRAPRFYLTIVVATLVAMLINFANVNPITALFWTAVLNGLLAPPLLILVMLVSSNPKVMRDRVNGRVATVLGWTTTVVMFLAAIALALTWKQ